MERPVMRSAAWASRYVVDADSRTNRGSSSALTMRAISEHACARFRSAFERHWARRCCVRCRLSRRRFSAERVSVRITLPADFRREPPVVSSRSEWGAGSFFSSSKRARRFPVWSMRYSSMMRPHPVQHVSPPSVATAPSHSGHVVSAGSVRPSASSKLRP